MKIILNGDLREFPEGFNLQNIIENLALHNSSIAVELNRKIIPKNKFLYQRLNDNDVIEIVEFVGGG